MHPMSNCAVRAVVLLIAGLSVSGCVVGATIDAAGSVAGAAVNVAGETIEGAVDIVTPDGDDDDDNLRQDP